MVVRLFKKIMARTMGDLEKIPPHLLKKFDEIEWESVESNLKLGHYGKNKKYATLYVDHYKAKRDASLGEREETRAEEALSISRSANSIAREALRIARSDRTIAIIAIIIAIASAVFTAISK